jgi:alkylation response protein AidB-like acyl-CoA dehydrogenase
MQMTKEKLAEMAVYLDAVSLLVARAARELHTGVKGYAKHSSIAKLYATDGAQKIVDDALQLFGAAEFHRGEPLWPDTAAADLRRHLRDPETHHRKLVEVSKGLSPMEHDTSRILFVTGRLVSSDGISCIGRRGRRCGSSRSLTPAMSPRGILITATLG